MAVISAREAEFWALEAWRRVLTSQLDPHPFETPEWQRAWWSVFGTGTLAVVELGEVGVAALHVDGGVARFLGGEDVTDYPGPALVPGGEVAAATLLREWLAGTGARLEARFLAPAFARALGGAVQPDEPVAVLPLPESFGAYLRMLGRHDRHELRRKRGRFERAHPDARVHVTTDLDPFFALFRRARGRKRTFMTPAAEAFFRRVAAEVPSARLDVLEAAGRPLAITFGFQTTRAYYLYNMAFDPDAAAVSPGIVLLSRLIERAIDDGLERFDFLRGLEPYKLALGGRPSPLLRVRVP